MSSPSSMCVRRVLTELLEMERRPPSGCLGAPMNEDPFVWRCSIEGPKASPYEGGVFEVLVELPKNYPFHPPKATFLTKVYHCNIDETGTVCLDILWDSWSPSIRISSLLVSLQSMLSEPNPSDPLSVEVAELFIEDRKQHDKTAKDWTRRYALRCTSSSSPSDPASTTSSSSPPQIQVAMNKWIDLR
eukprot:TRINITY_DN4473_c0_g2_i1.p1 TRINITY_DN4473_c0_g2~~TRINITY_DN4473_c0_g2_i1.p1  ORF type:complete len:188 (-),score=33.51 TRINITY_DN4473_c0_g2_i1:461-1024(-)